MDLKGKATVIVGGEGPLGREVRKIPRRGSESVGRVVRARGMGRSEGIALR